MRGKFIGAAVVMAMAGIGVARAAQTPPAALTEQEGLRMMRQVLSAEMNAPMGKKNGFGTLADVLSVTKLDAQTIDTASALIKGYTLRVSRADDRQHVQVTLTPVTGCGTAWFGDERNLIYTGKALGCK